jgi:hypothetical protein
MRFLEGDRIVLMKLGVPEPGDPVGEEEYERLSQAIGGGKEGVALILDTRFLIAHAFPPSDEERRSVGDLPLKDIKGEAADPLHSHCRVHKGGWNEARSRASRNKAQAMDS